MQKRGQVRGQYAYRPQRSKEISSEQSVRITMCVCTPETPVRDLCDACKKERRRILDRIRRRLDRGGAESGGITLSGREAARVLIILDDLQARQIAMEDAARIARRQLPPEALALLETLARLRSALRTPLSITDDERVEMQRPGAPRRTDTWNSTAADSR